MVPQPTAATTNVTSDLVERNVDDMMYLLFEGTSFP